MICTYYKYRGSACPIKIKFYFGQFYVIFRLWYYDHEYTVVHIIVILCSKANHYVQGYYSYFCKPRNIILRLFFINEYNVSINPDNVILYYIY